MIKVVRPDDGKIHHGNPGQIDYSTGGIRVRIADDREASQKEMVWLRPPRSERREFWYYPDNVETH